MGQIIVDYIQHYHNLLSSIINYYYINDFNWLNSDFTLLLKIKIHEKHLTYPYCSCECNFTVTTMRLKVFRVITTFK